MKGMFKVAGLITLVSTSSMAWWLNVKSVDVVGIAPNGNVVVKATKTNNTQVTYTVSSSDTNKKEIYAALLTAKTAGGEAQLSISGVHVNGAVLK